MASAVLAATQRSRAARLATLLQFLAIFACVMAAGSPRAAAQGPESSSPAVAPGAPQESGLLDTLKAPKAGAAFSYFDDTWHKELVGYWAIAQYGSKGLRFGAANAVPYIDASFGISGQRLDEVRLFLPIIIHPANILGPLLDKLSPSGRLDVIKLPDSLEGGIGPRYCPEVAINKQRIMESLAIVGAYRFGGSK